MFEKQLTAYLAHLAARGYTRGTRDWHACYLRQFAAWLKERHVCDAKDVTISMVESYRFYLKEEHRSQRRKAPLAASTYESHMAAITGFFMWQEKSGQLLLNPARRTRRSKPKSLKLPRVMSEEEALRILASCPVNTPVGLRDRAILELLYSTGIRRGEVARLNVQDFSARRGELSIIQGKGGKDRVVPVGEYASAFTQGYLKLVRPWQVGSAQEEALFVNSASGGRLSLGTVNYLVKKAVKRAGVTTRVTPHTFRHSMATHLLRNKADLRHIQAILGHSSVASTEIYTHLALDDLKKAVKSAHPRGRRQSQ